MFAPNMCWNVSPSIQFHLHSLLEPCNFHSRLSHLHSYLHQNYFPKKHTSTQPMWPHKTYSWEGPLSLPNYGTDAHVTALLETLARSLQVTELKAKSPPTTLKTPHDPIPSSPPRTFPWNSYTGSGHWPLLGQSRICCLLCTYCVSRRHLCNFNSDPTPRQTDQASCSSFHKWGWPCWSLSPHNCDYNHRQCSTS